ncbi:MAG: sulfatase-like hydrolase/transferase [Bacteroidales bacterium]|nr:sulfatase-like hydrolase/transferase [Bacteroidales bacterium]
MKQKLLFLLGNMLFWYVLFILARIAFLLFHWEHSSQLSFTEIFNTFRYGARLDLSMSAYLTAFPGLLMLISVRWPSKFLSAILNIYQYIVALLFSSIVLIDINLYTYWGFRLDGTPLFYMNNLKAMTASLDLWIWIAGIVVVFLLTYGIYRLYKFIFSKVFPGPVAGWIYLPVLALLFAGLFIPIRGGVSIAPLSISAAYFSSNQYANHVAINPMWNVAFSLTETKDLEKKYEYFSRTEMEKLVAPLLPKADSTTLLLKNRHPNIILIIVESLTAKAVGVTGYVKGVTPNLDSLAHEGILFDHIYASADRTDKGIASVLAAYPSLPGSSPLKYQKLTQRLNFLPNELAKAGYNPSFFYGGTLEFANYQSFLVQAGYRKFVSDVDFKPEELVSKWGAWDHTVLNRVLQETPSGEKGFFKTILTLTSHEPFKIPTKPLLKGNDLDTKFLNSLHYTDQAIGDFIREAKKRDWWENTLVVIIADHGNKLPGDTPSDNFFRQHIPMIWVGGALNVQDSVIHTLGSQNDLAATLLGQLGEDRQQFLFSKNLLSASPNPFAFYTFNEGFGFITPKDFLVYNIVTNKYTISSQPANSIMQQRAKAYLQLVYSDFFQQMPAE